MIGNCTLYIGKSINIVPHKNPFSSSLHYIYFYDHTLSPNEVYRHKTLKGHSHAPFKEGHFLTSSKYFYHDIVLNKNLIASNFFFSPKSIFIEFSLWLFYTVAVAVNIKTPPISLLMIDARSSRSHCYKRHKATNDCWAGWRRYKILFLFCPLSIISFIFILHSKSEWWKGMTSKLAWLDS